MSKEMVVLPELKLTKENVIKEIKKYAKMKGKRFATALITPEIAKIIKAELEIVNRGRTLGTVKTYSSYISTGKWDKEMPHGLVFDNNGNLIDGGHRIDAVIDSNKPAYFTICVGVPKETQKTIDQGKPRTVVDVYRIGHYDPKNKNRRLVESSHAAILRSMICESLSSTKISIPKLDTVDFLDKYFNPIDTVLSWYGSKKGCKHIKVASSVGIVVRAYLIYAKEKKHEKIAMLQRFVGILTGEVYNIQDDEVAAHRLREYLQQSLGPGKQTRPKNRTIYRKTEKALYLYLNKEPCDILTEAKSEYFPIEMTKELINYLDPTKNNYCKRHGGKRLTRKIKNIKDLQKSKFNRLCLTPA